MEVGVDLSGTEAVMGMEAWQDMGVPLPIIRALKELGFTMPTEIQRRAIPVAMDTTRDVIGAAETVSNIIYDMCELTRHDFQLRVKVQWTTCLLQYTRTQCIYMYMYVYSYRVLMPCIYIVTKSLTGLCPYYVLCVSNQFFILLTGFWEDASLCAANSQPPHCQ